MVETLVSRLNVRDGVSDIGVASQFALRRGSKRPRDWLPRLDEDEEFVAIVVLDASYSTISVETAAADTCRSLFGGAGLLGVRDFCVQC
jgi:hypothetical protein